MAYRNKENIALGLMFYAMADALWSHPDKGAKVRKQIWGKGLREDELIAMELDEQAGDLFGFYKTLDEDFADFLKNLGH